MPEIRIGDTVILKWRWDTWNTLGFSVAGIILICVPLGLWIQFRKLRRQEEVKEREQESSRRDEERGQGQESAHNSPIVVPIEQADAFLVVEEGEDVTARPLPSAPPKVYDPHFTVPIEQADAFLVVEEGDVVAHPIPSAPPKSMVYDM